MEAWFKEGILKTYFKKGPNSDKFKLDLNPNNIPYKQVFEYRYTGKTYVSKKCNYSQFDNGLKMCSFTYKAKFLKQGEKIKFIEAGFAERPEDFIDNDLPKIEIRYDLCKK